MVCSNRLTLPKTKNQPVTASIESKAALAALLAPAESREKNFAK